MYCKHCGAKIDDNSIFCGECGESVKKEEKVNPSEKNVNEAQTETLLVTAEETMAYEQAERADFKNSFLALFNNKRYLLIIAISMGSILLIGAVVLFYVFFYKGSNEKQEQFTVEQSKTVSITSASTTSVETTVSTTGVTTTTEITTTVKKTTAVTTTTAERKQENAITIDESASLGIGIVITDGANGLNLRSEPSADSNKVTTMNETSEVIVYDCGDSDWYYCKFNDKEGYAKKEFIQVVPLEINHYNDYYGDIDFELYSIIASDIDSDGVFEAIAYYHSPKYNGMRNTIIHDKNIGNVEYFNDGESGDLGVPFVAIDKNINKQYLGLFIYGGGKALLAPYPDTKWEYMKRTKVVEYHYDNNKEVKVDEAYFEQYMENVEIITPEEEMSDKYAVGHWIEGVYSVS